MAISETDLQYKRRTTQVQRIMDQAKRANLEEISSDQDHAGRILLVEAMMTPPILFKIFLKNLQLSYPEFLDKISAHSLSMVKWIGVGVNLGSLSRACQPSQHQLCELSIDETNLLLYFSPRQLYSSDQTALTTIIKEGTGQAVFKVLELIQVEDIPLIRYRRNLLQQRVRLKPTSFSGETGFLPTKITGVEVRFFYPKDQNLPILSLVVNPF